MSKKLRTHGEAVKASHAGMSPEQIAAAKNQRCRERHAARKAAVVAAIAAKPKRSPQEQLAVLDARLGVGKGASRERTRLLVQIGLQEAKEGKFSANPPDIDTDAKLLKKNAKRKQKKERKQNATK